MKQMPIGKFKLLRSEEIRESACLEVTSDGSHLFYAIIGAEQEMKGQITSRMSQIDAMRGK